MAIKVLVLSGGGGRGAFHAGVYNHLWARKWIPDIVVGTSIGAVNGAAITQGMSADELARFWLDARAHHIQGLPPGMRPLTRFISNRAYKTAIGSTLPQVKRATTRAASESEDWDPLPFLPRWISRPFVGRWSNLLDTQPLRESLVKRLKIDIDAINRATCPKTLLINATNAQTGEQTVFSNKPIYDRKKVDPNTGERLPRKNVQLGISINRIVASCSIPMVYPLTVDEDANGEPAYYWDGAVVANTPLSPALDAAADHSLDEPMEAVVVLMTPWVGSDKPVKRTKLPTNFMEAATITLDWALLSSFRETVKTTDFFNKLAMEERQKTDGRDLQYREVKITVVAPEDFFPVTRVLDYDEENPKLIRQGEVSAERALEAAKDT